MWDLVGNPDNRFFHNEAQIYPYINLNKSGIQCESLLQRQKKCKVKKKCVKVVNVHVHKPSCTTTDVYMAETSKCTDVYIKRNNGTDQICDFVFVSFLMMHLIISFRLKVAKIEDAS